MGEAMDALERVRNGLIALRDFKVTIHFSPVGKAPRMKQDKFNLDGKEQFQKVVDFMKQVLKTETVFLYINNSFTPPPSEYIADLYNCFKVGNYLSISYSLDAAYS